MPDRAPARLPVICRVLIRAASWLVPRGDRPVWLRKWYDGAGHWWAFLNEREEFLIRDGYAQLVRHCATAFIDAFWLRIRREELRRMVRGPAFVLVVAALFWCITGFASGGFRTLRQQWHPIHYPNAGRLVVISSGMFGQYPNPPGEIVRWKQNSKTLSDIAAYSAARYPNGWKATPNFFSLLGVRPILGRTFVPGDRDTALLSEGLWRGLHQADPGVVGRTVPVGWGMRSLPVAGVVPDDMPGIADGVPFWTVLDLEAKGSRRWVDTIALLKPGVQREDVEKELAQLGRAVREVRVKPLRAPVQMRTIGYGIGISFGLLLGIALVAIGRRSPVAARVSRMQAFRSWAFLLVKFVLVLGGLAVFWIEIILAIDMPSHGEFREFVRLLGALIPTLLFFLACALAVLWCVADQRRRCPVCLHRLAMPVTMGSWSSSLLNPATTEFLCENGHGSLAIPETQSSAAEPDRWTAMDESWRDLFTLK
jgi:hypothetical protein